MIFGAKSNFQVRFKFDGNTNDSSNNSYNATLLNGAVLSTNKWGTANRSVEFDGSSGMSFDVDCLNWGVSDVVIQLIYKSDDITVTTRLQGGNIDNTNATTNKNFLWHYGGFLGGQFSFSFGKKDVLNGGVLDLGIDTNWHYFTFVYDRTNSIAKLFKDGIMIDSYSQGPLPVFDDAQGASMMLGGRADLGSADTRNFDGKIGGYLIQKTRKTFIQQLFDYRTQNLRKAI